MALPITFTGTAGNDISTLGFTKFSGDTGSIILSDANRARCPTNPAVVSYVWPTDTPPSADYDVEADFVFLSNTTVQRIGITGRASDAARTFYLARIYNVASSTSNVQLYKAVAGTFTQLGSNYSISSSGTYNIRLSMVGSAIKVFVNDVERISVTDTSITAAGKIGFYQSADTQTHSNTTGFHIDNLTTSFEGGGEVTGTLAVTEDTDTLAGSGVLVYSGDLAVTEVADTISASGTVEDAPVEGTLAVTEAADTASAAGVLVYSGSMAVTEELDTAAFSGTISVEELSGDFLVTEEADTFYAVEQSNVVSGGIKTRRLTRQDILKDDEEVMKAVMDLFTKLVA